MPSEVKTNPDDQRPMSYQRRSHARPGMKITRVRPCFKCGEWVYFLPNARKKWTAIKIHRWEGETVYLPDKGKIHLCDPKKMIVKVAERTLRAEQAAREKEYAIQRLRRSGFDREDVMEMDLNL